MVLEGVSVLEGVLGGVGVRVGVFDWVTDGLVTEGVGVIVSGGVGVFDGVAGGVVAGVLDCDGAGFTVTVWKAKDETLPKASVENALKITLLYGGFRVAVKLFVEKL